MTTARTFEGSHPWIRFAIPELRLPEVALLLGEAKSKCDHIAMVPLLPRTAQELHQLYLAKGVLATTAIEGNTLTEEEVLRHLEGKLDLPPSKQYLAKEIDNIADACNKIAREVSAGRQGNLSVDQILAFNKSVLEGLELDEGVVPGKIREHSVVVARYRGAPAEDCRYLLERLCDWLNSPELHPTPEKNDLRIVYALIRSVLAHLYIAWIHPFGDGNGRTARLIEFQILVSAGLPTPAAHLLSNHYNQTRSEYYRRLDGANKDDDGVLRFLSYAIRGFVDGLRQQIERIRQQQWEMTWRDYVYDRFREQEAEVGDSRAHKRRRRVVLDLSTRDKAVALADIASVSPALARLYASKTSRTLSRDLNALEKMGLVEKTEDGFRARKELILGLLPFRLP